MVKSWCPNCDFFFKAFGMNFCHKANWKEHPLNGGDPRILAWLKENQDESTRIYPMADKCPGFLPYAELAQRLWQEANK